MWWWSSIIQRRTQINFWDKYRSRSTIRLVISMSCSTYKIEMSWWMIFRDFLILNSLIQLMLFRIQLTSSRSRRQHRGWWSNWWWPTSCRACYWRSRWSWKWLSKIRHVGSVHNVGSSVISRPSRCGWSARRWLGTSSILRSTFWWGFWRTIHLSFKSWIDGCTIQLFGINLFTLLYTTLNKVAGNFVAK